MTSFKLEDLEIFRCGDCPKNASQPNPLYLKLGMPGLAETAATHSCSATFPERLLLNPNIIPNWCPFIQKKEVEK